MKLSKITVGFSLVALLAMAGCGGNADDDPLTGTWSNETCHGSDSKPADIESCETSLTFEDDLTVELKTAWLSLAATATTPGCTTTWLVTGQQWSTNHEAGTFTVTGDGSTTKERTNCVNDADDMDATPATDISMPTGETTYALSGDTLSVTSGSLEGSYSR